MSITTNDIVGIEARLSVLETQATALQEGHQRMEGKLEKVIESINKSKGFWAGVVAAGTALGAALGAVVSYLFHLKVG